MTTSSLDQHISGSVYRSRSSSPLLLDTYTERGSPSITQGTWKRSKSSKKCTQGGTFRRFPVAVQKHRLLRLASRPRSEGRPSAVSLRWITDTLDHLATFAQPAGRTWRQA
jgi:hypothetical protein